MIFRICHHRPLRALEVGIGTGFLTRDLLREFNNTHWILNDIAEGTQQFVDRYLCGNSHYLWGDAESIEIPEGLDLICSASTVQWFDDLPSFIDKCARNTNCGGYLAITTFGRENFHQIKSLTGEGLDYYTTQELTTMLHHSGYHIEESLEYIKDLTFDSAAEVLKHIKATGVNGIKPIHWTRKSLRQFEQNYHDLCPEQITLTYHPIIIIAKRVF